MSREMSFNLVRFPGKKDEHFTGDESCPIGRRGLISMERWVLKHPQSHLLLLFSADANTSREKFPNLDDDDFDDEGLKWFVVRFENLSKSDDKFRDLRNAGSL